MYDDTTKKCESACGADSQCDEKLPHSYNGYTKYCDSNCYFNECKASTQCKKADEYYCTYVYNYAGYTGWAWMFSLSEDGNPWQECFDTYNNDCDGKIDCADENCKG